VEQEGNRLFRRFRGSQWVLLALAFFPLFARAELEFRQDAVGRRVELEVEANVPDRFWEVEPAKRVAIYHFDIPLETAMAKGQASLFQYPTGLLDPAVRNQVFITKKGKKYLRFFVPNAPGSAYGALQKQGVKLESDYWGVLLPSHSTYAIWPKSGEGIKFYVKFQIEDEKSIANDAGNAEVSVANSAVVENLLKEDKDGFLTMMPERLGVGVNFKGVATTNIFRTAEPKGPKEMRSYELFPLHGLFGRPAWVADLAKRRGLTPRQWITTEYMPQLGKALARLHFQYGIYPVAHTQNLLARIDQKTGKVMGFVIRDMSDIMFDPFVRISQNLPTFHRSVRGIGTSRIHDYFLDSAVPLAKEPDVHWEKYDRQTVVYLDGYSTEHPEENGRRAIAFLLAYRDEAERLIKRGIQLSPESLRTLENLQYTYDTLEVAKIVGEIQQKVTEARLPSVPAEALDFDQAKLKTIFEQKRDYYAVAMLRPDSKSRFAEPLEEFSYAYDGKGILAISSKHEILGYAYDLDASERRAIARTQGSLRRSVRKPCKVGSLGEPSEMPSL